MSEAHPVRRIGIVAVVIAGLAAAALAHARNLDDPAAIRIVPLSKDDVITPKSGAILFDADGIQGTAGGVVSPFTLMAVVGDATLEVTLPEFQVDQEQWVAEPIGCSDDDPKTKCLPTWGTEYSGQPGWDLPVYVQFDTGARVDAYGTVNFLLNVTVVDNKVRNIDGYIQVTFSPETGLANYRVPVVGKLKTGSSFVPRVLAKKGQRG